MSEKEFCRGCLYQNRIVLYEKCDKTHYHNLTNKEGREKFKNDYHFSHLNEEEIKHQLKIREELTVSSEKYYRECKRKYEAMLYEYRKILFPEKE